jgi:hypothetical protein
MEDNFYITLFITFITFLAILLSFIVYYLWQLESNNCGCAMDWRRPYIISYLIVTIFYLYLEFYYQERLALSIRIIYALFAISALVFIFQYIAYLKSDNCTCSESRFRETLYYVALGETGVYAGALLFGISYIVYRLINNEE